MCRACIPRNCDKSHLAFKVLGVGLQCSNAALHIALTLLCLQRFPHTKGNAALVQCLQNAVYGLLLARQYKLVAHPG